MESLWGGHQHGHPTVGAAEGDSGHKRRAAAAGRQAGAAQEADRVFVVVPPLPVRAVKQALLRVGAGMRTVWLCWNFCFGLNALNKHCRRSAVGCHT